MIKKDKLTENTLNREMDISEIARDELEKQLRYSKNTVYTLATVIAMLLTCLSWAIFSLCGVQNSVFAIAIQLALCSIAIYLSLGTAVHWLGLQDFVKDLFGGWKI